MLTFELREGSGCGGGGHGRGEDHDENHYIVLHFFFQFYQSTYYSGPV